MIDYMKFIFLSLLIIFGHMPAMATEDLDRESALEEMSRLMEQSREERLRNESLIDLPDDFDFTFPLTDEEFDEKVFYLDWKISETETIKHFSANAELPTIYYDQYYLDNKIDILQFLYWVEGILFDGNKYEVYQEFDNATLMYSEFNNEGYVKLDDWKDIDLDNFLEEKRQAFFLANEERKERGLATVKDVQWLLEPELDEENKMVHYVFAIGWSDGYSSNNGTSLILGRNGYTKVDSVYYDDGNINETINFVKTQLKDYKFNNDHQYSDYKSGDKIAAAGIAALVAASFGVKGATQVAAVGKGLLKFWWVLLAPFVFIGRLFRKNK